MTVIFIPQETKNELIAYSAFFFFSTLETQSRNKYIKVSSKVNKVSNNVKNPGRPWQQFLLLRNTGEVSSLLFENFILTRIKRTSEGEYGFPSSYARM